MLMQLLCNLADLTKVVDSEVAPTLGFQSRRGVSCKSSVDSDLLKVIENSALYYGSDLFQSDPSRTADETRP
uniref:Uncharacterized protein n=1 Tax=Romanomermis culicivorax TaxID=13658 RepID=A0A915KKL8_ROMCU